MSRHTVLPMLFLATACCPPAPSRPEVAAPTAPVADPEQAAMTRPEVAAPPAPTATTPILPSYLARRGADVDDVHGSRVADPYRWLEDGKAADVRAWDDAQTRRYTEAVDAFPQRAFLAERLDHLWRYDDQSVPWPCLAGKREHFVTKRADQDKWVLHLRERPGAKARVVLDPNRWEPTETLDESAYSDDCGLLAYGKARAGDEDPVIHILDVTTGKELPDRLAGWRQGSISWLPDGTGFYYSAQPRKGDVAAGDEHYYQRVYFHRLGTDGSKDPIVFEDKQVKEHYHWADVSEDGRWLVLTRSKFYETEVYLKDLKRNGKLVPVVTGFGNEYLVEALGNKLIIVTNWKAPRRRVMLTSARRPGRDNWQEIIAEGPDLIQSASGVAGNLYVHTLRDAATRVTAFTLDGKKIRDVTLPGLGSASVAGYWSRKEVRVRYESFGQPPAVYRYELRRDALRQLWKSPIDFDAAKIVTEQVWYPSRDGTKIPMFLVHAKGAPTDGSVPYYLTGYGGFNSVDPPSFSTVYGVWIEAGGGVAIPALRGGGEYGDAWHQAGMKDRKQNVFDDFIGAAEWLISNGRTRADRLSIAGGSNGGLLVAAAMTQRPELFRAVLCKVPLTDMIRYQKFGLANVWAEEYGSSDDAAMVPALLAYSPYHRVKDGADYPATLVIGSDNDARVDAMHARKLAAALQWADPDHGDPAAGEPIYYAIHRDSGHHGGVTIATQVEQSARELAFLMAQLGMTTPAATPAPSAAASP